MTAKMQTRLVEKRSNLGERLPLDTPLVLAVDPSNLCNLCCDFCPTGHKTLLKTCTNRKNKIMDYTLYTKIIDDLSEFPSSINVLRLYKEGEPLVNPHFSEMVKYARKKNVKRIDTTTNGLLLEPELNRKLVSAGLDQINISINGISKEQYFKYTGKEINYDNLVRNIEDLYNHKGNLEIYVKVIKDNLSDLEQEKFIETFEHISDRIFMERIAEPWPGFHSKCIPKVVNWGNYGQEGEEKMACPYLFYILVVNSDGTVSTCIGDWKHEQIIGDVNTAPLSSIWNGDLHKQCCIKHLTNNRYEMPLCKECNVITFGCYDNIDKYSEDILKRLQ